MATFWSKSLKRGNLRVFRLAHLKALMLLFKMSIGSGGPHPGAMAPKAHFRNIGLRPK